MMTWVLKILLKQKELWYHESEMNIYSYNGGFDPRISSLKILKGTN